MVSSVQNLDVLTGLEQKQNAFTLPVLLVEVIVLLMHMYYVRIAVKTRKTKCFVSVNNSLLKYCSLGFADSFVIKTE